MVRISVITPCFNSAAFVRRTVASVRAQTLGDWEHVIVDDGSSDRSAEIVETIGREEPRLKLIRQPNRGVATARNTGFRACSKDSQYLLFLDADDCVEPQALEVMSRQLDEHPEVGVVHTEPTFIDADDRVMSVHPSQVGWSPRYVPAGLGVRVLAPEELETPFASVYNLASIIPSVSLIRRSVYEQAPGWDESFGQHYEDTDLLLQLAIRSRFHFLPRKLVHHRRHAGQNTADPRRFGRQEDKLFAKWRNMPGLTVEQQRVLEAARRFREGPMALYGGMRSGTDRMRRGQWASAARFYAGAIRRYAGWFFALPMDGGIGMAHR